MTIHSEHPFSDPDPDRDPARRLRGRLGGAVTLWTTGTGPGRAGLTVSSVLVAHGDPARILGLLDPEADLVRALESTGTAVVALLGWPHRDLADAFAGVAPAPGGPFRMGTWEDSEWGPVLQGVPAWAGIRIDGPPTEVGWSLLVEGVVEYVAILEDAEPLVHRRGRYVRPS